MLERGKKLIGLDIEANGLRPDKIWCISCKDFETNERFRFRPKTPYSGHIDFQDQFREFVHSYNEGNLVFIGHNILAYDLYWINKLMELNIHYKSVIDTLVLSRLFRPVSPPFGVSCPDDRRGGHSLEAWGERLGFPKFEFDDWSKFSEEQMEYCDRDVDVLQAVYFHLIDKESEGFSQESIRLEHKVAWLLAQQERNGFYLDKREAKSLYEDTTLLLEEMKEKLLKLFPPVKVLKSIYQVKYKKDGEIHSVSKRILQQHKDDPSLDIEEVIPNEEYKLFKYKTFNPQSSKQIGERLLSLGWEPQKRTPKGAPATDKATLFDAIETLLDKNASLESLRCLSEYNIVADRQGKAEKWLSLVEEDGRVHGRINPIGAGTHRCSHYNDNMANIAKVIYDSEGKPLKGLEGKFGWESRACWSVPSKEKVLVGADASGIQLRALAHYMNDPVYTKKLVSDDIHVVHQKAAGLPDRPTAKTFIYAWLLGAGDEKIGSIVGIPDKNSTERQHLWSFSLKERRYGQTLRESIINKLRRQGRKVTEEAVLLNIQGYKVKQQFLNRTPALKRLKTKEIPLATKKGYLKGLDGRKLWIPNEHLAMSLYLQGFEAVVMKAAMCVYSDILEAKKIPFKQVNFVHDEWCIETYEAYGDLVGRACVKAIEYVGEKVFNVNCPLTGSYAVGKCWAEVH